MLHIILMILKILGILIISVLGAILFCPIRYSFEGSIYGKPQGEGKITWLCRFVQIVFSYQEEKVKASIFLLGISLKKRKKRKSKKSRKVKNQGKQEQKKQQEENSEKKKIEKKQVQKSEKVKKSNFIPKQEKHLKQKKQKKRKQKRNWKESIKTFIQKKKQVIAFIKNENNQTAFYFVKGKIFKLLCHILPGKIKIRLHYGFDDPAVTGMVTGFFFWFYPSGVKKFELMPDFERQVFEGEASFSGKVQIFRIVGTLWSIYHHKECKRILKSIRKE